MADAREDEDGEGAAFVQLPTDRYQLDSQLGAGGMATVFRAWDAQAEEWVAIKVLNPGLVHRAKMRRRFEIEALALQKLDHRNIITVRDTDLAGDRPYIVMELAEGGCLIDWIREYGPLPPRMAVDAAIQICKGVAVAHAQGIVHRDIKPHNILMNHRGVCKLTDFGIAQLDAEGLELTRTGAMMGTLGYIAPEQRSDARGVDERVDVYSIGASFYTMLTGKVAADLFYAEKEPSMLEGVPDELRGTLMKATAYDRNARFPDVTELAKALHAVRNDLPATPSDTPSLVMRRDEEILEPPAPPPAEVTYGDVGTTPAPVSPRSYGTLAAPSEDAELPGSRLAFALAASALLTVLTAGLGAVVAVSVFEDGTTRTEQAYYDVLVENHGIVDDLAQLGLGANRSAGEAAYRAQIVAADPQIRRAAAESYVAYLQREVDARTSNPPVGQRTPARDARAKLEAILRSREREAAAREESAGCGS